MIWKLIWKISGNRSWNGGWRFRARLFWRRVLALAGLDLETVVPLKIRLLGEPAVVRSGRLLELPRSKKTRALLGYLIATGREHRRERLTNLLWAGGDDRRAGLRWSLSRLRGLLDEPDLKRIQTRGELVEVRCEGARVDVMDVEGLAGRVLDDVETEELERVLRCFRGVFLEGLDQPDQHDFMAWCIAQRERFRALHVRLLQAAVERNWNQPEGALPHARELVRLEPDSVRVWLQLLNALQRAGSRSEAEEQFALARRKLEPQGALALQELRAGWLSSSKRARQ